MKHRLAFLLLVVTVPVHADTLTDVRAAVTRLSARQPVRATLTIQQSVKSQGKYANDSTARLATAEVRHDENGISITIPQSLLDRAARQAWSPTAGGNTAQDAIGTIRPLAVVEALSFRDAFLGMIDGAKVLQEKRGVFRGTPARLLVLKLAPPAGKAANKIEIGSVKADDTLNLWVGNDNLPVAADRIQTTTAGFLFIKGSFSSRMSYTFDHTADRLLLTRLEIDEGGSGMGQHVEKKSLETLTLH